MTVHSIERTVQKTHEWLKEIAAELGSDDQQQAFHALRSVLHHLRDRMPVEEAAHVGAELPMLIRGVYYEGWKPSRVPVKIRHKDEFLAEMAKDFPDDPTADMEQIARAVFKVLKHRIDAGEIDDMLKVLPEDIRAIFE